MDHTIRAADVAIVIATLLGPVLAVQAQKWLERQRSMDERRRQIFRALMSTRAARLAASHVEALNAVPVEFYGEGSKLKAIVDRWHTYLDTLENAGKLEGQVLAVARQAAFLDMLHAMSIYLGYTFSRSELEKDVYYPAGHRVIEDDQEVIRSGFARVLKGELAIPMSVRDFPATADDETLASQAAIAKALLEWLEGQRTVNVSVAAEGS